MNSLTTYYRNRAREYRTYVRSASHAPTIDTIHNLRVVIKKMRALYHLAASHDPHIDFDLHFESFTEIFKEAGKLRDIDITRKYLSEIIDDKTSKKLSEFLRKERSTSARNVKRIAKIILSKEKLYDKDMLHSLEGIKIRKIKNFLYETQGSIKTDSKKKMDAERLHGIRKLSKEYLYLSHAGGKTIFHASHDELRKLDPLQKSIGDWHDYLIAVVTIELLSKKNTDAKMVLKALKKEERKMKAKAEKML